MEKKSQRKSTDAALPNASGRPHFPFIATSDENRKGPLTLPSTYVVPSLQYVSPPSTTPESPVTCCATDLLSLHHLPNPLMIFGHAFSGKTCLFLKLISEAKASYGCKYWIRMIDLRMAAFQCFSRENRPKSILEFLAEPLNMSRDDLGSLFKPLVNAKELLRKKKFDKLIKGDLFLDGFDEISDPYREYVLKLLPQLRKQRPDCPIRVWINCRSYLKDGILQAVGDNSAFEIVEFDESLQKKLLFFRWKETLFSKQIKKHEEDRLREFTEVLYNGLCNEIKNFQTTIAMCPLYLEVITSVFCNHATQFINLYRKMLAQNQLAGRGRNSQEKPVGTPENSTKSAGNEKSTGKNKKKKKKMANKKVNKNSTGTTNESTTVGDGISIPTSQLMCSLVGMLTAEFLEYLTFTTIDIFCLKYLYSSEMTERDYNALLEREFRRAIHRHAQYAIETFPSYQFDSLVPSKDNANELVPNTDNPVDEELYRMGLLLLSGKNNRVQLRHKLMGDYFVAKHFSNANNLNVRDPLFDSFYLRTLLFNREAKHIRSIYDSILLFGGGSQGYRPQILHDFLVKHYKLGPDDNEEWEKIRNNGSVLHLCVMEGFHRTASIMVKCFDPVTEREKVRKLLRIKVPIEVQEGFKNTPVITRVGGGGFHHTHLVSTLSVIAMFAYSVGMEELMNMMLLFFTIDELREEFSKPISWTPLHYAAMTSNLWFFINIFNNPSLPVQIQPPTGIYNHAGQLPIHLLKSYSWYFIMNLKDHFMADYDELKGSFFRLSSKKLASYFKSNFGKNRNIQVSVTDIADSRQVTRHRNMKKDLEGPENMFRLAHHECIRLMTQYGGEDINAGEVGTGNTLLHFAADEGNLETVKYLLSIGAAVQPINMDGRGPLHHAAIKGHRHVLMCLMRNGANVTMRDIEGKSSISMWIKHGIHIDKEENEPMSADEKKLFKTCRDVRKIMHDQKVQRKKEAMGKTQRKLEQGQGESSDDEEDYEEEYDSDSFYENQNSNNDDLEEEIEDEERHVSKQADSSDGQNENDNDDNVVEEEEEDEL